MEHMSYNDLISSYILKNGGDNSLVTAVFDYLEHAHPHDEPVWEVEFDDIAQAAVAYANSKERRHARANAKPATSPIGRLNDRHLRSFKQEADAIRRELRRSNGGRRRSMLERLTKLETLMGSK
jgi:hypothetical protein